ncbi:MAG: hypothetical protein ACO1QB_05820 [Verrucomicrobiales bacterium]
MRQRSDRNKPGKSASQPNWRVMKASDFNAEEMCDNNWGQGLAPRKSKPASRWYYLHPDYLASPNQLLPLGKIIWPAN